MDGRWKIMDLRGTKSNEFLQHLSPLIFTIEAEINGIITQFIGVKSSEP